MFASGSIKPLARKKQLLSMIASAINPLPNKIRISGHTGSQPFKRKDGYSNWELSGDRSLATGRILVNSALAPERIESVAGRAAQDPLLPQDTTSQRNRRVNILLLKNKPPVRVPPSSAPAQQGARSLPASRGHQYNLPFQKTGQARGFAELDKPKVTLCYHTHYIPKRSRQSHKARRFRLCPPLGGRVRENWGGIDLKRICPKNTLQFSQHVVVLGQDNPTHEAWRENLLPETICHFSTSPWPSPPLRGRKGIV